MAILKKEHKVHIIRSLARYASHSEIRQSMFEKFGIKPSPAQIQIYDVAKAKAGKRGVGKELQELYYTERDRFLNDYDDLPLTRRGVRLRELSKAAEIAKKKVQEGQQNEDIRVWTDCIMKIHRVMQDVEGANQNSNQTADEDVKSFYQQINQNVYFNK